MSLAAVPAFAEGGFSSSLSGVRVGFQSRGWVDRNVDTMPTQITVNTCSQGTMEITLQRDDGNVFFPDTPLLRTTFDCARSAYMNAGRLPADNYIFQVSKINGSTSTALTVSSPAVDVVY
ncbi:hypothetical protein JT358_16115 [Micrococcales bacterium 31B]|nr:hypothetical protein [Micrococcales bacterium 31B]